VAGRASAPGWGSRSRRGAEATGDESLRLAAQANPEDKFALVFSRVLESLFVERMEQNEDIFARFMNDREFQEAVANWLTGEVYKRLKDGEQSDK
jgi:type I restriction enzyme R subunit